MVTSWPSGSSLPKPRKQHARSGRQGLDKAARELRKLEHTLAQVERNGIKYVPLAMRVVIPEQTDPLDAERCAECGRAIATLPVAGKPHGCPGGHVDPHAELPTKFASDGAWKNKGTKEYITFATVRRAK